MTVLIARPPLQSLPMSVLQAGSRRMSSRLQEKDDVQSKSNGLQPGRGDKKRKNAYDEEDDGFSFSRVNKSKKPRRSQHEATTLAAPPAANSPPAQPASKSRAVPVVDEEPTATSKTRRKKMSFSTPRAKEVQPVRRSKRLSSEAAPKNDSPVSVPAPVQTQVKKTRKSHVKPTQPVVEENSQVQNAEETSDPRHSATKIALPFADTPVMRRNKAMREGKGGKGDRRSSLGLRGRRASSLIDTGNSNALPHQEVEVADFYKHIESDLMEPRRMRQLLTWCATRAMHAKPKGTGFEDASAKSAARVIEEELLKELSNKSELSDWFSREDVSVAPEPLPERPNPKNVQNVQKISELEQQIERLKIERKALQKLLQPPEPVDVYAPSDTAAEHADVDRNLLSSEDAALLDALTSSSGLAKGVSDRINSISSNIEPLVDEFADGIHKVAQYRIATDSIAGKVLSISADKFANREKAGRRKALHTEEDRSPGRDLSDVLRGLSRADR